MSGVKSVLVPEQGDLLLDERVRLTGEDTSFKEHATGLVSKRPHAPAVEAGELGIELALQRLVEGQEFDEMAPAQLSRQCLDNGAIREQLREAQHVEEIRPSEATAELRHQASGQRPHDLFAIVGSLLL